MNQALELIAEANEHRAKGYIRDGEGNIVGDDPLHHAIADRALVRLATLSRDDERTELLDERILYALEEPLEFCQRYLTVERDGGVALFGPRDQCSEDFVYEVLCLKAVGT